MPLTLADVPEEILERILALILVQSPEFSPRPSWHPYTAPSSSSASNPPRHANIISPLLVCRAWLRIATPIHYRHPVLRTPRHAELLLRALRLTPALAPCVRSLHLHATSPALRDLVAACPHLHTLDITVDNADALANSSSSSSSSSSASAQAHAAGAGTRAPARVVEFCEAFARARSVRHLVVRKNAYLTQPNATYVFEQLAKAIGRWHKLETVNVAFRLSPSPAATALTEALAAAPRLHTLYTQLPAVWNTTLLDIAQNPALARIVLSPAPEHAGAHLFLAEAKRHPRLVDLIRAGTAPPSPHPGRAVPHHHHQPQPDAFSFAGIARARAASSAVHAPMPVATWGYEREVPAPVCPPYVSSSTSSSAAAAARRPGPGAQPPSAYAYAPSGPQDVHYPHGVQYAATAAVPVPAHAAGAFVGGQVVQQKRAAGSRRMTAS